MTTDQKTGELLPCPFCGFSDWLSPISHMGLDSGATWIVCPACTMCGPPGATEDETVERWNRRAERNAGERWVDASERKPDTGTCPTVLCCSPCWDRPQALIWTGRKWLWDFDGNECSAPVTHWMQMPALPTTAARREG